IRSLTRKAGAGLKSSALTPIPALFLVRGADIGAGGRQNQALSWTGAKSRGDAGPEVITDQRSRELQIEGRRKMSAEECALAVAIAIFAGGVIGLGPSLSRQAARAI